MSTTAWKTPGTIVSVDDGGSGDAEWQNPENAGAEDASYAATGYCTSLENPHDILRGTAFGFDSSDIPDDATITGIEARFKVYYEKSGSSYLFVTDHVFLVYDGAQVGDDQKDNAPWPEGVGAAAKLEYGGDGELWGYGEITPAIVRDSSFGFDLQPYWSNIFGYHSAAGRCDVMEMRVYFTRGLQELFAEGAP